MNKEFDIQYLHQLKLYLRDNEIVYNIIVRNEYDV